MASKRLSPRSVVGNVAEARRSILQLVSRGRDLMRLGMSTERRLVDSGPITTPVSIQEFAKASEHITRVQRWERSVQRILDQRVPDDVPTYTARLARLDTYDRVAIRRCNSFLERQCERLEILADAIARPRAVAAQRTTVRLDEVRSSGLIDGRLLTTYERRMSRCSQTQSRPDAIGAAKEVVEAVLMGCLDAMGTAYAPSDNLSQLSTKLAKALRGRSAEVVPLPNADQWFTQLMAGMRTLDQVLGELRNRVGTGHGRRSIPKSLGQRHAQLAVDLAVANARFLVLTLSDLGLLPT